MWSSLPLFLQAEQASLEEAGLPLSLHGTEGSGLFGGVPLHLYCDDSGNVKEVELPLFLAAVQSETQPANLNLWLWAEYPCLAGGFELHLENTGEGAELPLFISGSGTTEGSVPCDGFLNLFVRFRPGGAVPLFLAAPGRPCESGVPLYVRGAHVASPGLDLSIPAVVGESSSGIPLYLCGW